jgi:hypothetical protein
MICDIQACATLHKTAHTLQVPPRTGMMQCSVSILQQTHIRNETYLKFDITIIITIKFTILWHATL